MTQNPVPFDVAAVCVRTERLATGGTGVAVEVFSPAVPGQHPVVVLLHGADGLSGGQYATDYRRFATTLASRDFAVAFPRYFESTGHGGRPADPITVLTHFLAWAATIDDTIAFAAALPEADPKRLALIGTSLGGTLAIGAAAQDGRVTVLVDVFGGFPEVIARRIRRLPPTLILHGEKDRVVPVADSRRLANKLDMLAVPHELKVYPDAGHGFAGADEADAIERTVKFLHKHLR